MSARRFQACRFQPPLAREFIAGSFLPIFEDRLPMHGVNAKRTAPEVGIGQTPRCLPLHSGGLAKSNSGMLNGGLRGRRLRETGASTSAVYSSGRRGSAIVPGLPGSRTASRTQGRFVAKLVSRVSRVFRAAIGAACGELSRADEATDCLQFRFTLQPVGGVGGIPVKATSFSQQAGICAGPMTEHGPQ
jgi:hypothetical protein